MPDRDPRYGNSWIFDHALKRFLTNQTTDPDGERHNLLPSALSVPHLDLVTMCGLKLGGGWKPSEGVTSCQRCGLLAAYGDLDA